MNQPLVSVICLCYNHAAFVQEAITSVLNQTYKAIEIIVVDDASTDNSVDVIERTIVPNSAITFLSLPRNQGICKAFNKGFSVAHGDFIIDFATDDVMHPQRVQKQVEAFGTLDKQYGVVFTDAVYVNGTGNFIRNHFDYLFRKRLLNTIPQGDVYKDVLSTYFIASPTMMVKREVFETLNGYDETLAYEDFDFWVRSSRAYHYFLLNEKLTKIRLTEKSMSTGWYKQGDAQLHSTYLVCKKAQQLNRHEAERQSLLKRVHYELRHAIFSENRVEASLFYQFLADLSAVQFIDRVFNVLGKCNLPLSSIRNLYHRVMFPSR